MKSDIRKLKAEYRTLCHQLAKTGWISHGYVQDRGPGAGGPCYQLTRKEQKKTVSVVLSKEQYQGMQTAIQNWRQVQETLKRMQQISRTVLFLTLPNPTRRKPLTQQALGLK